MASSVFFKFKSSREPQRITFDGTGISVFELKREIIAASGLGDGTDFDLFIYPEDNPTQEYDDDTTIISRSSTVIARRLPASKPGAGRAARYVSGRAPVRAIKKEPSKPTTASSAAPNTAQTEKEREEAFLLEADNAWEQQKEVMSHAKPVFNKKKPVNVPTHDPPAGYVCYRCQQKGHWIQACPTNDDPNFKPLARVKRTTGIPKSLLKTIEKPADEDESRGVLMNEAGEYVKAITDEKTWQKFQAKANRSAAQAATAAAADKEVQDRGLSCPIDNKLFVEPVKTPCCGKTYCHDCIENALADGDLVCPNCSKDGVLIDDLEPDKEMLEKIKAFEQEKVKEKLERAKEDAQAVANPGSPSNNDETSVIAPVDEKAKGSEINRSGSKSPPNINGVVVSSSSFNPKSPLTVAANISSTKPSSPKDAGSDTDTSTTSKKRPATEDLPNERKAPVPPTAPKAMRQQQEQQQQQQQSAATNNIQDFMKDMNALKNMPMNMQQMSGPQVPNASMSMSMGMNPMMGMMNPMGMNNMGSWGGYDQGYPNMYNQMGYGNMPNMNQMGMGYGMDPNMNQNWGGNNSNWNQQQQSWGGNMAYQNQNFPNQGNFPNQQRNWMAKQGPNEDSAYLRAPVNPDRARNRHHHNNKRPMDFHEVGQ